MIRTYIVGAVVVFLMGYVYFTDAERDRALAKVDKLTLMNATLTAQLALANEQAQVKQDKANKTIEKVKNDLRVAKNLRESDRASAAVSTDSLLKHLEEVKSRIPTDDTDSLRTTATRTSNALGQCAAQYQSLAGDADRLATKSNALSELAIACHTR